MTDTVVLDEGDIGVVIRSNGDIQALVPLAETRPISPLHTALLGAAIGVQCSEKFRLMALEILSIWQDAELNGEH